MPNPGAEAPLRKITLNLFEDDVELIKSHYGRNWSGAIRDVVGDHAALIRRSTPNKQAARTLGDLDAD